MNRKTDVPKLFLIIVLTFVPAFISAATWTICPSGCDYTSIQTAYSNALAGDTLELRANLAENLYMMNAKACNITSQTGNRFTWDGANDGNPTLTVESYGSAYNAWTISNIVMDHSSASGGYVIRMYRGSNGDINPNLTITQSILMRTSPSNTNGAIISSQGSTWNGTDSTAVTLTRTELIGSSNCDGLWYDGGNNTHPYDLTNCILRGFTGTRRAIFDGGNNWAISVAMTNCTFFNNNEAYRAASSANGPKQYIKNCLFIGNTSDIANLSASRKADITYCAISGSGYGTGCQYNPVAANEVVNPDTSGTPDLHLLSTAPKSLDKGTNTGAPAVDYPGNPRPFNLITDIGAYEYVPSLMISKSANVNAAYLGDTITYCITYTNSSTTEDKETDIWDTIPGNMVFSGCNNSCDVQAFGIYSLVHWYIAVPPGAYGTMCFYARITDYVRP